MHLALRFFALIWPLLKESYLNDKSPSGRRRKLVLFILVVFLTYFVQSDDVEPIAYIRSILITALEQELIPMESKPYIDVITRDGKTEVSSSDQFKPPSDHLYMLSLSEIEHLRNENFRLMQTNELLIKRIKELEARDTYVFQEQPNITESQNDQLYQKYIELQR